jgi:hypothetical protein
MEWPNDLDDYVLALAGVRTGTFYNVIARKYVGPIDLAKGALSRSPVWNGRRIEWNSHSHPPPI